MAALAPMDTGTPPVSVTDASPAAPVDKVREWFELLLLLNNCAAFYVRRRSNDSFLGIAHITHNCALKSISHLMLHFFFVPL